MYEIGQKVRIRDNGQVATRTCGYGWVGSMNELLWVPCTVVGIMHGGMGLFVQATVNSTSWSVHLDDIAPLRTQLELFYD